jgi:hypothetical protein
MLELPAMITMHAQVDAIQTVKSAMRGLRKSRGNHSGSSGHYGCFACTEVRHAIAANAICPEFSIKISWQTPAMLISGPDKKSSGGLALWECLVTCLVD